MEIKDFMPKDIDVKNVTRQRQLNYLNGVYSKQRADVIEYLPSQIFDNIDKLKEIKDNCIKEHQIEYNKEYWIKLSTAHNNLHPYIEIRVSTDTRIYLLMKNIHGVFEVASSRFTFDEMDLIVEQHQLLQKIYNSRGK